MAIDRCSIEDREYNKFVESPTRTGEPAVEVVVGNPSDIVFGTVGTPTIYNVTAVNSGTEYSQALSANTKKFTIRTREKATIQLAYTATESATNFITIPSGASMFIDGLNVSSLTLYFQTDKANTVVEIQEWV